MKKNPSADLAAVLKNLTEIAGQGGLRVVGTVVPVEPASTEDTRLDHANTD